jgi:RNA polymerase sigma-70 factor, ECF subfamily
MMITTKFRFMVNGNYDRLDRPFVTTPRRRGWNAEKYACGLSQTSALCGHYPQRSTPSHDAPSMIETPLSHFEEHRQLLFGIAYRMLGSVTDAQDMVQETYLRWHKAADDAIRSPRAWLTTVLTRLCINQLQLARVKRETYVGEWLPEPLVDDRSVDPAESSMLADSLSLAFLVILETLNPTERAVFILREGFECEFSDIARIVEKSETNCRQLLARARKRIDERRPRYEVSRTDVEKLVPSFLEALKNGDLETMLTKMASNVVLVADSGAKPGALLRPLHGAETVSRAMINAVRKHGLGAEIRVAMVNGLPGVVRFEGDQAHAVLAFGIAGGRIQAVFVISNPEKLRHLRPPGERPPA